MTQESPPAAPVRPPRFGRRLLPVLGLVLLSPWVAEYLVGSHSVRDLPLIVFLVPMYGGGALLIREVARRTGRGWPTMLLLGLAYGVIEAGLLDQSLFNPDYAGEDFQSVAHIPGLRISGYFGLLFVTGHAIWSIGVPIAIIESLVPHRSTTPWLRTPGLVATAGLYLLGGGIIYADLQRTEGFSASPLQFTVAATLAVIFVVAAFRVPNRPTEPAARAPKRRILVLLIALVASRLLWIHESWFGVGLSVALLVTAAWLVARWARSPQWSRGHRLALAAGALLTQAWDGFHLSPWRPVSPTEELIGDIFFTVVAITLILLTIRRLRRDERPWAERAPLPASG
ncbi:hypothetical protein OG792_12905 [Micromonospora sp. NBC_01699]|uniref:hypothetical protein n=1 Tax=Micromonospora sp. NBC_01699 TaxID=2975984 RepID=UPI002E377AD7|nr:hypothetical protein [Micromonospora sp. NBC_01699]